MINHGPLNSERFLILCVLNIFVRGKSWPIWGCPGFRGKRKKKKRRRLMI